MKTLHCYPYTDDITRRDYVSKTLFNRLISIHKNVTYFSYNEVTKRHIEIKDKIDVNVDELSEQYKEFNKRFEIYKPFNADVLDNLVDLFFKKINIDEYDIIKVCRTYEIGRKPRHYCEEALNCDFIELDITSNKICFYDEA